MGYICHFLASAWIYIGMLYYAEGTGWIQKLESEGILRTDYSSIYIAGIYYVLLTLTTVGYGDVVGDTDGEHLFQMIVVVSNIKHECPFR